MSKSIIKTDDAPQAIGTYSQAVKAGGFLFCSGQIPLDPGTGELVSDDAAVQAERVLNNLAAVIETAGATLTDVVKTTIYLKDMGDFATVNEVYGTFFTETPPARATVEVSRLPKDVLVEIDAVALIP